MPKSKFQEFKFFPTQVYKSQFLRSKEIPILLQEIEKIRTHDSDGLNWSKKNYPGGFTTYGSLDRLDLLSSSFLEVKKKLDRHVIEYSKILEIDSKNSKLELTQMWVNVQEEGGHHSAHIHPLSTISGTFYLKTPKSGTSLKFEDPRLSHFMASPPRKSNCSEENRRWVEVFPKEGDVILFESWLRHEVPLGMASKKDQRISVSFNYS